MRNSRVTAWGAALLLVLGAGAAYAEAPNPQAALARAQGMLKQLNDAKQNLEVENAKLKASNASLEQQVKIARLNVGAREADIAARGQELGAARDKLARLEQRNEQLTARLEEVVGKYKDLKAEQAKLGATKEILERELSTTRAELADAEAKNRALYQASHEILERYQHKSRWTALLQKEPFTGIKQVEVESRVQADENALREQLRERNLDAVEEMAGTAE